jgi:hypothetical protein
MLCLFRESRSIQSAAKSIRPPSGKSCRLSAKEQSLVHSLESDTSNLAADSKNSISHFMPMYYANYSIFENASRDADFSIRTL